MLVDLNGQDVEVLLVSLEYSKLHVREAPDTPYDVRKDNLLKLDAVADKLRAARRKAASK